MEIKEMSIEQIEERMSAIDVELNNEDADLEALKEEVRALKERKEEIRKAAIEAEEARKAAAEETITIKTFEEKEKRKMENIEVRNTPEYIDAFAKYVRTGKDVECRALITENTTGGTIPVPEMVYEVVKHAWETEGIMSRVKKAYLKGNIKVGFEISATGATVHTEGAALDEETLVMGVIEIVPKSIKKWISISDEALDLDSGAFLEYVYSELAYQIAKKAADEMVAKIIACGTVSTTTCVGVPAIASTTITVDLVSQAIAQLSDEAAAPVIMMNKTTWAGFKKVQYDNKFSVDPFEGCDVVFNNTIPAFSAATTGVAYAIVGDLGQGALANLPNGEGITFKFDDMSLAEKDLVKIVGREYIGLGVVAPKAFCKITK